MGITMDRRRFNQLLALSLGAGISSTINSNAKVPVSENNLLPNASRPIMKLKAGEKKLHITYLIFDGVTSLDFIGPSTALSKSLFNIDFVAKDKNPIFDDNGLGLIPTATFSDMKQTDILCVPGTANPYIQIVKKDMIDWVAQIGQKASWVTSVCTGSFILGAAGLLKGYKATAHWTMINDLAYFGAIPTHERIVKDRNRLTGGGITSGIDFGLTLLATLKGIDIAQAIELSMEYDPNPPFKTGSPRLAPAKIVEKEQKKFNQWLEMVTPNKEKILVEAAKQLGVTLD
ncbi:DJ-1/PfpI family protein [Bartonella sp. HY329]|uniref:DJ-1/PfpI family protein n=1 Tax=unclassified Bartonella TaxID=2645622 RepID=UPI0021C687F2|nr:MULTISPECIES: DJ-1/PfpI family protein [unclassified Bartonella]UXM94449.1 DJ-1/PfpI family protein [Bartonella sp. HY329]UXN08773.1 DJ-1/PfpI family protein [Bartonella sp. HY328]